MHGKKADFLPEKNGKYLFFLFPYLFCFFPVGKAKKEKIKFL